MTKCNIKSLITSIVVSFVACTNYTLPKDNDLEAVFRYANDRYGSTYQLDTMLIYQNVALYEYQSNLYDFIGYNDIDTLCVSEYTYQKKNHTLKIWTATINDTLRILDKLEWNHNEISY